MKPECCHCVAHRVRLAVRANVGFTLLELIIALSILLAVFGLAVPRMTRYLGEFSLRRDSDLVMHELAAVRMRAIDSGLVYQFRYEIGGRRFLILPYERPDTNSPMEEGVQTQQAPAPPPFANRFEIGTSCQFAAPATAIGATGTTSGNAIPELWLQLLPDSAGLADAAWSAPILFYPDGRSDSATIDILDNQSHARSISVRALTGSVSIGPLVTQTNSLGEPAR